jgi:hypothetical protein
VGEKVGRVDVRNVDGTIRILGFRQTGHTYTLIVTPFIMPLDRLGRKCILYFLSERYTRRCFWMNQLAHTFELVIRIT